MKRVIDKANYLNEQFGSDLDRITDSLGLSVMYEEMNGRMKEFYFRGAIVVREDLATREKRELIAHALGHHLFHAGNHLAMQKRIYSFGNYHEKQANAFAACLLIPLSQLSRLMADRARIDEIADNFGVTEELVRLRLMIWANFEKDLSGGKSARVG
ncbi:MAG: ImmA/IrrE family metallo-endopeptidase [Thermoleophilia bacterium]